MIRKLPSFVLLFVILSLGADKPKKIVYTPLPKPTSEIIALINQLGSDQYMQREVAENTLKKIGAKAIVGLEDALENTSDLETKVRANEILDYYFTLAFTCSIPSVYDLSNDIRFPDGFKGKDVSLRYFLKTKDYYNDTHDGITTAMQLEPRILRHTDTEAMAFRLYLYDQMQAGMSKKDAVILTEATYSNHSRYDRLDYSDYFKDNPEDPNAWEYKRPGPWSSGPHPYLTPVLPNFP